MRKAFVRVEWPFLKVIMQHMGFPDIFIDVIISCISSVKYSDVVNGNTCGIIIHTRG